MITLNLWALSRAILLSALFSIAGCVAVWGSSYNVALANSRSIVIEYDRAVVSVPQILGVAQQHCDKYGADAILDSVAGGNIGIVVNTYMCIERAKAS